MFNAAVFALLCGSNFDPTLVSDIETTAQTYQVPADLLAALVVTESTCNASAVSSEAAIGYTQIVPKVWEPKAINMGLDIRDPQDNLRMSAWILSRNLHKGEHETLRLYHGYRANPQSIKQANAYSRSVLRRKTLLHPTALDLERTECICDKVTCSTSSTLMARTMFVLLQPVTFLTAKANLLWEQVMQKKSATAGPV
jgi:hypothetical protein